MKRHHDLEQAIRESYDLIREYESIIRTSDRPEEKLRARRVIREQRALIAEAQSELDALPGAAAPPEAGVTVEPGAGGHVFISYSQGDSEYAHRLQAALQGRGFEVWIDDRIDYGARWPLVIEESVDACAALILLMSPRAKGSTWVQNELARAQAKGKAVFPLLLEGDCWAAVQATQYVDVREGDLPPERFYLQLGQIVRQDRNLPAAG
jgi:hypothetical protein